MSHARHPYGPEPSQFFELWKPAGTPRAAVALIHGGLWLSRYDLAHLEPLCRELRAWGFLVANLEYRRVGNPGGGWPGTFQDVHAGFQAARAKTAPDLKWLVLGHSAGGHLALWLAGETDAMAATLALAPVADLEWPEMPRLCLDSIERLLGGSPEAIPEVYRAANPARRSSRSPLILCHGSEDELVPLAMSQAFQSTAPDRIELHEMACGHFDFIAPESRAWQATLTLLEGLAPGRRPIKPHK